MYCQHCGNQVDDPAEAVAEVAEAEAGGAADVAAEVSTAEVRIAEIQANRDITLAKIERGIIGQQVEAAVAEDAVKAELLDDMLAPPEPEPVPLVIEDQAEAEDQAEPDSAPPETDSMPEPAAAKSGGNAWWG